LSSLLPLLKVLPFQEGHLTDPDPTAIEHPQQKSVPWVVFQSNDSLDFCLRKNPLSQFIPESGDSQGLSHVKSQIPDLMSKRDQGFYRRKHTVLRSRFETSFSEVIGEALEIPKRDLPQLFVCESQEPTNICPIRLLGVRASTVKPKGDHLLIITCLPDDLPPF